MSIPTALLDACVLFPAPLRDTLLRAAEDSMFIPYWSNTIVQEVSRNLVSQKRMTDRQARNLVDRINAHFPDARVVGFEDLVPGMKNHHRDRHVLAAAISSHAQFIVTFNLNNFYPKALHPYPVEPQSPDVFLLNLLTMHPVQMLNIVALQASNLRKPATTIEMVLENLAIQVPEFVAAVRKAL